MSARPKTSDGEICQAVCRLLATSGAASVSMQAVAEAVGLRAPSLYKRFGGRDDLLSAAMVYAFGELKAAIRDPLAGAVTYEKVERIAHDYRSFARKNGHLYGMLFSEGMAHRPDLLSARAAAADPMLAVFTLAMEKDAALSASRTLVSYLHGFLSMELATAFRCGEDVDGAFQYGLTKTLDALLGERAQGA